MVSNKRLLPTGECWCGCGNETGSGSFFKPGHDKVAESAVILTRFGGIAEFLDHYGIGPGGRNPRKELEAWRNAGGQNRKTRPERVIYKIERIGATEVPSRS